MKDAVLVTTTCYDSVKADRFPLALEMVENARKAGLAIIVNDGSPPDCRDEIRRALADRGAIIMPRQATALGACRREVLEEGMKAAKVVVWLEPEKVNFPLCVEESIQLVLEGVHDIVVPARDEASWNSYPAMQVHSEKFASAAIDHFTKKKLDWMFAPKVMNRAGAQYFVDYKGEYGDRWEGLVIPVVRAEAAGLSVGSTVVRCLYPPKQREDEERKADEMVIHRLGQFNNIVPAVRLEAIKLGLLGPTA